MESPAFKIPPLRQLAGHALPNIVEASLIPLALFYGALWLVGVWAGLVTALAWSYVALGRRLIARQPVPGLLVLGVVGITARTAVAFATGSVFVYFLQPTATTVLTAGAFLVSVPAGRPLAQRLAGDFCPLPAAFMDRPPVRRYFARITLLWAFVQLTNAGVTLWQLVSQPVSTYVVSKTVLSWVLTAGAVVVSTVWFRRSMRRHGLLVERDRQPLVVAG